MSQFLLTRPMRDVTLLFRIRNTLYPFLLTRPMRDVTVPLSISDPVYLVSTHTPHAGRDGLLP